jgi:hypothetical protein
LTKTDLIVDIGMGEGTGSSKKVREMYPWKSVYAIDPQKNNYCQGLRAYASAVDCTIDPGMRYVDVARVVSRMQNPVLLIDVGGDEYLILAHLLNLGLIEIFSEIHVVWSEPLTSWHNQIQEDLSEYVTRSNIL